MANDFSSDGNCKALWRFESGALTADSKGGNTLSAGGSPSADAVNYQEGAASVDLTASTDYYSITDAALDAGFPLKNGDSNKKITVCAWVKIAAIPSAREAIVLAKQDGASGGKASIQCDIRTSGKAQLQMGYNNGNSWESSSLYGTALSTGIWYHIAWTFQDSDGAYRIRIWDDNAGTLLDSDTTGTFSNKINVETGGIGIGAYDTGSWLHDCQMNVDELVVFDSVLSTPEIDAIRAGTYGAAAEESSAALLLGMNF